MPRKLKTYVTSAGFFEQAIAAPSMKAALEAWGSNKNAFHQGFAEETDDPAIVAAAMARPGVVLKRAVGSKGAFTENAELPKSLPAGKPIPHRITKLKPQKKAAKAKKGKSAAVLNLADARAAKQASVLYEKERARREKEQAKEEAKRQKEREQLDEAVAEAEAVLEKAEARHAAVCASITEERETLDRRDEEEGARWDKEKKKLETELKRAGELDTQ